MAQKLHAGLSAAAALALAFFVWLVHAVLYDIPGMQAGVLPAIVTLSTTCAFQLVLRSRGTDLCTCVVDQIAEGVGIRFAR